MAAQAFNLPRKQQKRGTERPAPTAEQVRERAYEIYCQRGEQSGSEIEDWLQAEAELSAGVGTKGITPKGVIG